MTPEEQAEILNDVDPEQLEYDWRFWGRPEQFAPEGFWTLWLIVAGRGFGKTRAGAEWVREMALANPGCRIALVGRTHKDVHGTMIYGESGILAVHSPEERPVHKISKNRLEWANGSIAEMFTAEEPDQIRGPQFHYAWADEAAAWKATKDDSGLNAWGNLKFATRLGESPRVIATTTPRRTEFMLDTLEKYDKQVEAGEDWDESENGRIVITRGSTYDNAGNLSPTYISDISGEYAGTNIAQQELMGLMLDEKTGALWTPEVIEEAALRAGDPDRIWRQLPIRCVALDPSVAEQPNDECGIVVVGSTNKRNLYQRHAYVLEDASVKGSPDVWAAEAVRMARKYNCAIIAEGTQGQALVANMIRSIDPTIKVLLVQTGNKSKKVRADPVVLPYEQHRVHHVGHFEKLEMQLTTWDPEISKRSPDRLDALVHGITALLIKPPKGLSSGGLIARSIANRQLPGGRGTGQTRPRPGSTR